MNPQHALISLRCPHRRAWRVASVLAAVLGGLAWFSGHRWGAPALILGWSMAWFWASLGSRRIDLGEKQGLAWTGWKSVCFNRGADDLGQGERWDVKDVLTQKSQQVETHWLSNDQRAALAQWTKRAR